METLLAHCSAAFSQSGNVFAVFFIGGLAGSLTHCLTMCGPVVACQAACGKACGTKLNAASQWPYHLGRLITYSGLGFVVALLSRQIMAYSFWPTLSATLLAAAAILFLASAVVPASHLMLQWIPQSRILRGALMGFMPCGLIYAALMAAATLASPLKGALAMASFVAGTTPALLLVSAGAATLAQRWQGIIGRVGRFGMAFNGLALLALAANHVR